MTEERGTLNLGEYHPSANSAMSYIRSRAAEWPMLMEALSSCAIEDNRLAEICAETLNRIMTGQPVSDRYLLGMAWFMKQGEEEDGK